MLDEALDQTVQDVAPAVRTPDLPEESHTRSQLKLMTLMLNKLTGCKSEYQQLKASI